MHKTVSHKGTGDGDPINSPISLVNLRIWARRTVRADRSLYRKTRRPLTVGQIWRTVVPNLRRPIFVVGAPRSGTTFLGKCIQAIPNVSYHYEPPATKAAARYVYEGIWSNRKARFFYRQVYSWLMRIHMDGELRFAEKTPTNCLIIRFLHEAFPDAQFVHIIRNGRDAALSHSKKEWLGAALAGAGRRDMSGQLIGPYARFWIEPERRREFETTTDIHRCIWTWRRFTESALSQAQCLPKGQYHELRYESLVSHPHQEADRLLEYLEIGDSRSKDLFHEAVSRANPQSVGAGGRELSSDALREIDDEAGILLRSLGY